MIDLKFWQQHLQAQTLQQLPGYPPAGVLTLPRRGRAATGLGNPLGRVLSLLGGEGPLVATLGPGLLPAGVLTLPGGSVWGEYVPGHPHEQKLILLGGERLLGAYWSQGQFRAGVLALPR